MKRLLGVAFVLLLAGAVSLSVLAYRKAFTPVTWVSLMTDHTGLQLNDGADVKLRGVIVGDVRSISSDGRQATLRLALDPRQAALIPANVTARMLPKTLFGERYVALQVPPDASTSVLRNGSVISQDRSSTAIELSRVLDDTLPLLRAIQPDKLAATLGALATALEGHGDQLGADVVSLGQYLRALNAQMPAIQADVTKLASVLSTYDEALPDLMEILRNITVTATTVTEQRDQLAAFLADTADLADSGRMFLDRYGDRIIQLGQVSAPVLELLAAYAPEYPCLLQGLVTLQPRADQVFSGGRMHITIEATTGDGGYVSGRDAPIYGADNGPQCYGLPNPRVPAPQVRVDDGYGGSGTSTAQLRASVTPVSMGYAGTAEERAFVRPLVAAATSATPDQVSDFAAVLWGSLLRGAVVNLS
jgi:phospholipid/cholesterol/gamma-HCH transport system substrate-binding protein